MTRTFLALFGLLYVALGVFCLAAPETASKKVGLGLVGAAGRSEFYVVYGGLELALGIFFGLCAMDPGLERAGLLLALITSASLALTRTATMLLVPGIPKSTWTFYLSEIVMLASSAFVWFWSRRGAA